MVISDFVLDGMKYNKLEPIVIIIINSSIRLQVDSRDSLPKTRSCDFDAHSISLIYFLFYNFIQ